MKEHAIKVSGNEFFLHKGLPLAVVPIDFEHVGNAPWNDYTYTNHYHDFLELVLITAGSGVQSIDGVDYEVSEGDLFLLQGNVSHFFRREKCRGLKLLNLLYLPRSIPVPWDYFHKMRGFNMIFMTEPNMRRQNNFRNRLKLPLKSTGEIANSMERLSTALNVKNNSAEAVCFALFVDFLLLLCRLYEAKKPDCSSLLPRINAIITKIENYYSSNLTLTSLAQLACTSPRNFTRQFKAATGTSPIEYLLSTRLRHGALLICSSNLSVTEVAAKCGFGDANYFTKKFRKKYGVSPRKYRLLHTPFTSSGIPRGNGKH